MIPARLWIPALLLTVSVTGLTLAQRMGRGGERWDHDEVVTLEGRITEVDPPLARLETNGMLHTLHLGPAWYWRERGYRLSEGDLIKVIGQTDTDSSRPIYIHTIVRGGETCRFADADGVPLWSGGRWGCGGPGWRTCSRGWHAPSSCRDCDDGGECCGHRCGHRCGR